MTERTSVFWNNLDMLSLHHNCSTIQLLRLIALLPAPFQMQIDKKLLIYLGWLVLIFVGQWSRQQLLLLLFWFCTGLDRVKYHGIYQVD